MASKPPSLVCVRSIRVLPVFNRTTLTHPLSEEEGRERHTAPDG
jgi:hypothetical protein